MQISTLIAALEAWAPLNFQEPYDNAGLIVGNPNHECRGVLCSLDCTEAVVDEAIAKGFNLIVSHHPIVFKGVKQFNSHHFVSRVLVKAIQNNIALYAMHTNLDNLVNGVNKTLADRLHLENRRILTPKPGFKDLNGEEIGSGLIGELPLETDEAEFLQWVKEKLNVSVLKHTQFTKMPLKTIALCGGSGSFLINDAKAQKADCYITSDLKYHDYFEADGQILLVDIGHWESEQWVASLILAYLRLKFPTFAVLESLVNTQPVHYLKD
jgi:dinuclear metal center YbgI/SA1388 family protein